MAPRVQVSLVTKTTQDGQFEVWAGQMSNTMNSDSKLTLCPTNDTEMLWWAAWLEMRRELMKLKYGED